MLLFPLQVTVLQDFFKEDDVFIAYGQERFSHDDFDLADEGKIINPSINQSYTN